jgi:hypothetical protein
MSRPIGARTFFNSSASTFFTQFIQHNIRAALAADHPDVSRPRLNRCPQAIFVLFVSSGDNGN